MLHGVSAHRKVDTRKARVSALLEMSLIDRDMVNSSALANVN